MKRMTIVLLILSLLLTAGCASQPAPEATVPETTIPETTEATVPETTVPETTEETESETTAETAEETEEPDPLDTETAEETETLPESVVPPAGAGLFTDKDHAYILYSVKDKSEYLLVLEADGEYYLYYREGAKDPLAPDVDDE